MMNKLSQTCFVLAMALSAIVVYGWFNNIELFKSALQSSSSMKLNTAICIGALAVSGILFIDHDESIWRKRISQVLALFVLVLVLLSAIEHLSNLSFGIDQLLVSDAGSVGTQWAPGRPSPVTLLSLFLLCFTLLAESNPTLRRIAEVTITFGCIIPLQALMSYFEGVNPNYGLSIYAQMAPHTAVGITLLSIGIILSRNDYQIIKVVRGHTLADRIGRLLLVFAVMLPPSLFWLESMAEKYNLWGPDFGQVIRIVTQAFVFSWIALRAASTLRTYELNEKNANAILKLAVRSRDEFLQVASHELRTPVTSLHLQIETLSRAILRNDPSVYSVERVSEYVERASRGINRLKSSIEVMLDVSRIQSGQLSLNFETTDVGALVNDCLDTFGLQFKIAGIEVEKQLPKGHLIEADGQRLEQVLANLATNAIRYAPQSLVTVRLIDEPDFIRLEFGDNGPGIDPKNKDLIFEKFERLVPAKEISGLGLGLFIAKQLVEAHRGSIRVESELNKGAKFIIDIPKKAV